MFSTEQPFCLFVYYAGKTYAIALLVVGLIYTMVKNIGRKKNMTSRVDDMPPNQIR
jgi:hypothetical protein